MNLTFTQAAAGVNKDVSLNVVDTCPKCQGTRAEPGTKAARCTYCNGTGMETISTGTTVKCDVNINIKGKPEKVK